MTCANSMIGGRVDIEHVNEECGMIRAEIRTAGTSVGALARPDRSSTSIAPKEPRLMPHSTYARPACALLPAENHIGGENS